MKNYILAASLVLLPVSANADTYNFSTLDVPNSNLTQAFGINNQDQVVGQYQTPSGEFGFLYSNGSFSTISYPQAFFITTASGINNAGDIVGTYQSLTVTGMLSFFYDGSSYQQIGSANMLFIGINDNNQIVGSTINNNGNDSGFLYMNGNFIPMNVPGSSVTESRGINNAGSIVGGYAINGVQHAFLYNGVGYITIDFPNSLYTVAYGINNSNQIVGDYVDAASGSNGPYQGFVYDDGTFQQVNFPGAAETEIFGINDVGDIVGLYYDSAGARHGFIASEVVPAPAIGRGLPALLALGGAWILHLVFPRRFWGAVKVA